MNPPESRWNRGSRDYYHGDWQELDSLLELL